MGDRSVLVTESNRQVSLVLARRFGWMSAVVACLGDRRMACGLRQVKARAYPLAAKPPSKISSLGHG